MPIELFPQYKDRVVKSYIDKKAANELSHNLTVPTPGKLKDECAAVCRERFSTKDEKTLRDFFGQSNDVRAYINAINHYDTDKFRPLVNFLKKPNIKTDGKNINLLAWLIDFEDRPFEVGKNRPDDAITPSVIPREVENIASTKGEAILSKNSTSEPIAVSSSSTVRFLRRTLPPKAKNILAVAFIFAFIATVSYLLLWKGTYSSRMLSGQGCMYWAGDHYQPIPCNKRIENTLVIALDSVKLNKFKKIQRPDTITQKSKGLVWYVKVNKVMEFYTSDGFHPVDIRLRLKPITDYIIKKYVDSAKNQNASIF